MINVAKAINGFASEASQAEFVPPSEEAIFVLTSGQLSAIITQAVEKSIQPLQDEITQLRATVDRQDEKIASLETTEEHDISRVCVDIAYDRQRIAKLEKVEPQPLQKDRGEILRALIAANGGKMLLKDARQKMHLSRSRFSELVASMSSYVELKPYHIKKNQKVLILK